MSQSTVFKSVGGVTTKITTKTKTVLSSTSTQQQHQIQQKVITKPPQKKETEKENHMPKSTLGDLDKKQQKQEQLINQPQQSRTEDACVRCNKTVYKMEEVIAEQQVWHRNCFRCNKCDKQLNRYSKVDSFQIHEGAVYCKVHFKQLFGPKGDDAQKRKPEPIIHENQPAALPDGVVLSSEPNDLGLENIQTDAVKTRFQMFEKISTTKATPEELQRNVGIKRSATVLSKMKKFHAKGMDVGIIDDDGDYDDDSIHSEDYDDDTDVDLIRAKRAQRERPLSFDNMADIKNKFEGGMEQGREERHKERKQEIQNIRSRLFMGKQARTKEMYENALVDLQTISKQRNKGFTTAHEMDSVKAAAKKALNIKQSFENGDIYRKSDPDSSLVTPQTSSKVSERMEMLAKQQAHDELIKSHAKVKDVQRTDITNQFEFFENYNPEEHRRTDIRMTPHRETVVDDEAEQQNGIKIDGIQIDGLKIGGVVQDAKSSYIERIKKSEANKKQTNKSLADLRNTKQTPTASKINGNKVDAIQKQPNETKLTKAEENQHIYNDTESEADNEISSRKPGYLDSDLECARQAARTRDLKDLFEKWNYENNVNDPNVYNDSTPEYDEIDDSQTETTKTIRAKFERLPYSGRIQNTHQPKVNRFV